MEIDEETIYSALTRGAAGHAHYNQRFGRHLRRIQLVLMAGFYGLALMRRPRRMVGLWRAYARGEERSVLEKLIRVKRFGHSSIGDRSSHVARRSSNRPAPIPPATATK